MIFLHHMTSIRKNSLVILRRLSVACRFLSEPNTLLVHNPSSHSEVNGLENALKILDLFTEKTSTEGSKNHLSLIHGCIHELLKTTPKQRRKRISKSISIKPTEGAQLVGGISRSDAMFLFFDMLNNGIKPNPNTLCSVLSACGDERVLDPGRQLHALAIGIGIESHIYVGSSLVTFYTKCGELEDAYCFFKEMPEKNVVSWTAIIAGFAQHGKAEKCRDLFHQMRYSSSKPNDFTFASFLSACTASSSLGQGRSAHCQVIHMGFDLYIHVTNALITMYAKCGSIEEAFYVFENMPLGRDLISWNAMIAGYSQHGLANQAINLLQEMKKQKISPDAITFLGVLSSCCHAGLVEEGHRCFDSMLEEHGVRPELDHYACIVDLLGRAGLLDEALGFIEKMPIHPNAVIWGSLLSSCRLHGNIWVGIRAAKNRLLLEPECAATHIQLANLYAGAGYWNDAAKVRKLMKEKRLRTNPGYSWIEIRSMVYMFRAEDRSNSKVNEIFEVLDSLVDQMRSLGYKPNINSDIHEEGVDYHNWDAA